MEEFTPKLVCFSCKFGWGYLSRHGDYRKLKSLIPVTCSGKLDATQIIDAFREGADGVIILGCSEGDCHFQNGNYQARKRVLLLQRILEEFGIEPERLKIRMSLDPDGSRIPALIDEVNQELKSMGPLAGN